MPATPTRTRATPSQRLQDTEHAPQTLPGTQGQAVSRGRKPLTVRICQPVQNRVPVLLVHIPKLSIRGQARLASEVGVSRSTVSRLVNGKINPSYRLARGVTSALERFLGRPLDMRDVFSTDGTYLTPSGCALCRCGGCLPEVRPTTGDDNLQTRMARRSGPATGRLQPAPGETPSAVDARHDLKPKRDRRWNRTGGKVRSVSVPFTPTPGTIADRLRRRLLALDYPAFARCMCCLLLEALGYEDARPSRTTRVEGIQPARRRRIRPRSGRCPAAWPRAASSPRSSSSTACAVHQRSVDELRGACLRAKALPRRCW